MIAIGIQRPGHGNDATVDTSLYKAFIAVTNIVFAFGNLSLLLFLPPTNPNRRPRLILQLHLRDAQPK